MKKDLKWVGLGLAAFGSWYVFKGPGSMQPNAQSVGLLTDVSGNTVAMPTTANKLIGWLALAIGAALFFMG